MSAPKVGDRVRVHGEPFRGDFGYVTDPAYVASAYLWDVWVCLEGGGGPRGFALNEVEKVPTTGADLLADPDAGSGAQNGGKR